MATFYSDIITAGNPAKVGVYPMDVVGRVTFSAAVGNNDLIQLVKVPPNVELTGFVLNIPILDKNATAAITYSLLDTQSTPVTLVTSIAQPDAAGKVVTEASADVGKCPYQYAPATSGYTEGSYFTILQLKCTHDPGTPQDTFPVVLAFAFRFVAL